MSASHLVEMCLMEILNNSARKVEFANQVLDIVRAQQELIDALRTELHNANDKVAK